MARALTPQDGYAVMTALGRQATGQQTLTVTNLNGFNSAGETVLATGMENVFNALSVVMGRTFVAARAYKGKLQKMNAISTDAYTNRLRKISFYAKDPLPSGYFNTNLFTNLADGFTNGQNPDGNGTAQSTKSQWEQNVKYPLEMNFAGSVTWQYCLTMYEKQIRAAFRDPVELAAFVQGMIIEHQNDIETTREAFNRMTLLAKIAQCYIYDKGAAWSKRQAINLTTGYNTYFGTNYTSAQLRSTYLKSFLEYYVSTLKQEIRFMTERTTDRHLPMTKAFNGVSHSILRHTPYDQQMLYMFEPLMDKAEAIVMPEIFNERYLDLEKSYEPVDYWQANDTDANRSKISVRVPFYDKTTGQEADSGPAGVTLDYVVAVLTDKDALMTDFQVEDANTTSVEARKGYRNTWITFAKNSICDPTENTVIFYMDDSDVTPAAEDNAEA